MQVQLATVTQKGQVTIPVWIRNDLGIKTNSKVKMYVCNKTIQVEPVPSIFDIAPIGYAKKGMNALKAREYMQKHYKRA